jgi:hypothetical protein
MLSRCNSWNRVFTPDDDLPAGRGGAFLFISHCQSGVPCLSTTMNPSMVAEVLETPK